MHRLIDARKNILLTTVYPAKHIVNYIIFCRHNLSLFGDINRAAIRPDYGRQAVPDQPGNNGAPEPRSDSHVWT